MFPVAQRKRCLGTHLCLCSSSFVPLSRRTLAISLLQGRLGELGWCRTLRVRRGSLALVSWLDQPRLAKAERRSRAESGSASQPTSVGVSACDAEAQACIPWPLSAPKGADGGMAARKARRGSSAPSHTPVGPAPDVWAETPLAAPYQGRSRSMSLTPQRNNSRG